jgi:hypothetical protein
MPNKPEPFITTSMQALIQKERRVGTWVFVGRVCIFVVYAILAIWIHHTNQKMIEAKDTMIEREMQTDSIKRAIIYEMRDTYMNTVNEWRSTDSEGKKNATPSK